MFKRNKTKEVEIPTAKNEYDNIPDSDLLNKLRADINELKKLNPKEPCLRHTLNDFMIKKGYSRMPNYMRLFEDFFNIVDRDYRNDFSVSRNCKVDELDCVIEILQNYRNEVSERYDIMKRESELREEIASIRKALKIE